MYNRRVKEGRRAAIDLRNQPAYPVAEAARYLKLPPATLRSWALGRGYPTRKGHGEFRPLLRPAQAVPPALSFWNLIEAHVLRALRTDHGVSIQAVRKAVGFAERELGVERLLLSPELCSEGGALFLDRYGKLINLSASGQLAMRQVLEAHLKRLSWDSAEWPFRLHPFVSGHTLADDKSIVIDPLIAFGRPVVASQGISTATIVARIDAGESVEALAEDYGLSTSDIEQAALYERAA